MSWTTCLSKHCSQNPTRRSRVRRERASRLITRNQNAASKVKPVNAVSDEAGNCGKNTLEELHQKVSQLPEILNTFAPVVQELKGAYDAVQQQDRASSSEGKINEPGLIGTTAEGAGEAGALLRDTQSDGLIDELFHEVIDNEPTDQALPEKLCLVLNNILASGLNEQALTWGMLVGE